MTEWTLGAVLDAIAEVVPDRLMTVCGDRRSTYAESAERARSILDHRPDLGADYIALAGEVLERLPDSGEARVRVAALAQSSPT